MWLRMYPSWTKACWKKCVSSSLHPHFVVYPNTLPPDWLNWCNKFWINASHFWRHKFKALVFSTGVMALSLSKKKDTIFFLFWICELFQSVKSYQWPKALRFLYLSFFSWILVAKKTHQNDPPPNKTDSFMYVVFVITTQLLYAYLMFIYVIFFCFAAYSIEFMANFFNSRKSASSPASAINAM